MFFSLVALLKRSILLFLLPGLIIGWLPLYPALASCNLFKEDLGVTSLGVSVRTDPETGQFRSLVSVGTASFLESKASLVQKARKKALLKAKADFARFLQSDFSSSQSVMSALEQQTVTDQSGRSVGSATELQSDLEEIRESTKGVLSGHVVLAECVDVDQKLTMVLVGWKPETAHTTTKQSAGSKNNSPANVGVSLITVETEGEGETLKKATNEAVRNALAQVLGESFASSQSSVDFTATTATIENTNQGGSVGDVIEESEQSEVIQSEVSGLVSSYRYIRKERLHNGIRVTLQVDIPDYKSSLEDGKKTLIVFAPEIKGNSTLSHQIGAALHNRLENHMNQSGGFNVLDRSFLKKRAAELDRLSTGNNSITQRVRQGQLAGADFMLVTTFNNITSRTEKQQLGQQTIVRRVFGGAVTFKMIEVATSNIISSGTVALHGLRFKQRDGLALLNARIAGDIARPVLQRFGHKISPHRAGNNSVTNTLKRVESSLQKLEKDVENDW